MMTVIAVQGLMLLLLQLGVAVRNHCLPSAYQKPPSLASVSGSSCCDSSAGAQKQHVCFLKLTIVITHGERYAHSLQGLPHQ